MRVSSRTVPKLTVLDPPGQYTPPGVRAGFTELHTQVE